MMKKQQIVKDLADANELMRKGYICMGVKNDFEYPSRVVLFFQYSDKLKTELDLLSLKRRLNK